MKPSEILSLTLQALGKIRQKLLDLTRRNRLLNYKESVRSLRIIDELPDEVFRLLISDGKSMEFLPIPESQEQKENQEQPPLLSTTTPSNVQKSSIKQNEVDRRNELPDPTQKKKRHQDTRLQTPFTAQLLERRCKRLLQESRTAIEETGSNLLHLAIGFLEWYEDDTSTEINRAPLILVPVQIERTRINRNTNCYTYAISYNEEDIETNISLAEKLEQDFDLILPEFGEETTPESYLAKVKKMIKNKSRWRVAREMVLGLFSFSKILMYKDLDNDKWPDNAKLTEHKNITQTLVGKDPTEQTDEKIYGEEYAIDSDPIANKIPLILDADSSQHSAIVDAFCKEENLVIYGPPGTGKSQTIVNLIAAALSEGKTVLFVAEKKAALEVVRSRLNQSGLGDFCLELHSHKTQKGQLHADLAKRIPKQFRDIKNLSLSQNALIQARDKLLAYSNLVNKTIGQDGKKIYDIFWAVEQWRSKLSDSCCVSFSIENALSLTQQEIDNRVEALKDIACLRPELPEEAINAWQWFKPSFIFPGDDQRVSKLLISLLDKIDRYQTFLRTDCCDIPIDINVSFLRQLTHTNHEVLDRKPSDYQEPISIKFLDPKNIETVSQLNSAIEEFRHLMSEAEEIIKGITSLSVESVKRLSNAVSTIETIGYGDLTPEGVTEFVRILEAVREDMSCIENIRSIVCDVLPQPPTTFNDFLRVISICNVVKKAPDYIAITYHPEHILELAQTTYQEARQRCEKLSSRLAEQSKFFNIRTLPKQPDISRYAQVLRKYKDNLFAFFFSEYRAVKRDIKGFLLEPKNFKVPDLENRLDQLADIMKEIDETKNNQDFQRVLGPKYAGIKTDWNKMERHVTWCQEFRQVIGSQSSAGNLLKDFRKTQDQVLHASETMQARWSSMMAALDKVKISINADAKPLQLLDKINGRLQVIKDSLAELLPYKHLNSLDMATINGGAEAYISASNLSRAIEQDRRFSKLLGQDYYNGMDTDTPRLLSTANWVTDLQAQGGFPNQIVKWLLGSDIDRKLDLLKELRHTTRAFIENLDSISADLSGINDKDTENFLLSNESSCELSELHSTIDASIRSIQYLITWADYCRACKEANKMGLKAIIVSIDAKHINPDDCVSFYLFSVYESMAKELIRQHPELASFTRASYENTRTQFSELDRQIMKTIREQIAYKASQQPIPDGVGWGPVKEYTEFSLITHELQKKKRHIPIRQLVKRAGNALRAIKPCFMMSPMSVAQYLEPGKIEFDLVIMDEASQIRPEDALGAIARAKQLVVVGDPNQLPPSTFFDRIEGDTDEDDEATAIQDTESILDICSSIFKKRRLRWHYRSEHESLIAFSNNQFYDDNLIIFPSPHSSRYPGVRHHYIEGASYLKGRNLLEAEAVALAIVEHFRSHSELSLGTATFNREQSDLIQDILERLQKEQPWLEKAIKDTETSDEPFFIKNLENVQGDERDVIFVSTTYGPDPTTGHVFQRFGPISWDTGWRRLNVIFTRAKKRLKLFTSMRSSDIKLPERPSRGVQALRGYLEYAETGVLPTLAHISGRQPDSDFEVAVSRILQSFGFNSVPQVGVAGFFIDIGVKHPERDWEYILGIECDGATYHSAKSVRDRDRLRQEILEKKGWKIHRIWSTDWFKNREKEIQRLMNTLKEIMEKDRARIVIDKEERKELPKKIVEADRSQAPKQKIMSVSDSGMTLKEELVRYNEANIANNFPDKTRGILREEMLAHFLKKKPTSTTEFYAAIPIELRQKTDSKQLQFLEDIFEIIQAYSD